MPTLIPFPPPQRAYSQWAHQLAESFGEQQSRVDSKRSETRPYTIVSLEEGIWG